MTGGLQGASKKPSVEGDLISSQYTPLQAKPLPVPDNPQNPGGASFPDRPGLPTRSERVRSPPTTWGSRGPAPTSTSGGWGGVLKMDVGND